MRTQANLTPLSGSTVFHHVLANKMDDDKIAQFMAITGSSRDTAQSFLQLTQNDLEEAMTTFYETEGSEPTQVQQIAQESSTAAPPSVPDNYTGPRTLSGQSAVSDTTFGASQRQTPSSSSSRPPSGRGGISTLRDLSAAASAPGRGVPDDSDEDGDDDDEMNYFAGGEKSALSVENPEARKRKNQPGGDLVKEILKRAAEGSQQQPEAAEGSRSTPPSLAFTGQGRTINDTGAAAPAAPSAGSSLPGRFGNDDEEDDGEVAIRNLTFWEDGFSIEDGPLMRYDDPANAQTLAAINSGHAPLSLLNVRFGQQVQVRVHRHTDQKFKPPPAKPFAGSGNRLGSPAPTTSSTSTVKVPSTTNASASREFQVDSSKPTTQLQIRLGDGQRMTGRFNTTHTVADVRNYINA